MKSMCFNIYLRVYQQYTGTDMLYAAIFGIVMPSDAKYLKLQDQLFSSFRSSHADVGYSERGDDQQAFPNLLPSICSGLQLPSVPASA